MCLPCNCKVSGSSPALAVPLNYYIGGRGANYPIVCQAFVGCASVLVEAYSVVPHDDTGEVRILPVKKFQL